MTTLMHRGESLMQIRHEKVQNRHRGQQIICTPPSHPQRNPYSPRQLLEEALKLTAVSMGRPIKQGRITFLRGTFIQARRAVSRTTSQPGRGDQVSGSVTGQDLHCPQVQSIRSHSYVKHSDLSCCRFSQSCSDFGFKIMYLSVATIAVVFRALASIASGLIVKSKKTQMYY